MKRILCDQEIIELLAQHKSGKSVEQLCQDNNVAISTFYKWKTKYEGLDLLGIQRLKLLENENTKLKKSLWRAELDIVALKDLLAKKW